MEEKTVKTMINSLMIRRSALVGLPSLLIIFLCCHSAEAQAPDIEAAKKEGSVVVYGSVVPQAMQINAGFEKKYGIRVEYWRADSTNIMDRTLTEWRAGKPGFDVLEGSRAPQIIMKKRECLPASFRLRLKSFRSSLKKEMDS